VIKLKNIAYNKKQANVIIDLIRKYYHIIDPEHANKLASCSNAVGVEFSQGQLCKIKPLACFSPLCPICINRKVRKQMAITAQCFNHIALMPEYADHQYYHICLTVSDCPVHHASEAMNIINHAFHKLSRRVVWKNQVVGDSRFYHFGLNAHHKVHPHIHLLALLKPDHELDSETIALNWAEVLGVDFLPRVYCMPLCGQHNEDIYHVMNLVGYGLKTVKYREILNSPDTYFKLMNNIKFESDTKNRLVSHRGLFLKVRNIVEQQYQEEKVFKPIVDTTMVCKFDGHEYYQDQMIFV